jgi:hypothetical protein
MKKLFKSIPAILLTVLCVSALAGCFGEKVKVFEKSGIKITATDAFYEKEQISMTLYLESSDKIITALKEEPSEAFPITKPLGEYTAAVLSSK